MISLFFYHIADKMELKGGHIYWWLDFWTKSIDRWGQSDKESKGSIFVIGNFIQFKF